jgi:hypothetical protein
MSRVTARGSVRIEPPACSRGTVPGKLKLGDQPY